MNKVVDSGIRIPESIQVDKTILQRIINRTVKSLKPRKVILFGSRVEGRAKEHSDIDLLVVLDEPMERERRFNFASQLGKGVGLRIQLIPILRETYEETKDVIGGIAYLATKYGVVLYENP